MDMLTPVVMIVTFRVEPTQIVLNYSVENKSGGEIYLVNHLTRYEQDKGWLPDPKVIYAAIDEKGIIELSKRVPPLPEDRFVTLRSYYVTPLPDGEKFEEEVAVPIPLQEHRPYDPLIEPIPEPREIDAVLTFSLGYFEAQPHIEAKEVVVHGIPAFQVVRRQLAAVDGSPHAGHIPENAVGRTAPTEKILSSELGKLRLPIIQIPKRP